MMYACIEVLENKNKSIIEQIKHILWIKVKSFYYVALKVM